MPPRKRQRTGPTPPARSSNRIAQNSAANPQPTAADEFFKAMGRAKPQIPTYKSGHDEYKRSTDTVKQIFRFKKPDCVVRPRNDKDVQKAVKTAKQQGVKMVIKNGGHSYSGASSILNGILLDLDDMRAVTLDLEKKTVTIGGGATWAHVYHALAKRKLNGIVISGGRCPAVGVSGFVLGGGIGPFTRTIRMGCDSIISISLVTASGKSVKVFRDDDSTSREGRLFWALCGAGGGNFGVVTEVEMEIKTLKSEWITSARYTWFPFDNMDPSAEQQRFLQATMDTFYAAPWSETMTIDSTWLVDLRKTQGTTSEPKIGIRFTTYYVGEKQDFDTEIDDNIDKPLSFKFLCSTKQQKSSQFLYETLGQQWKEDQARAAPERRTYQLYSSFCFDRSSDMHSITTIIRDRLKEFHTRFKDDEALAQFTFIHSGGAATNKGRSDSAFRWRQALYHGYIMVEFDDWFREREMLTFFHHFKNILKPHSLLGRAAFLNFPDYTYKHGSYERRYFGGNHRKLQRVKRVWDPDNYFDWFQGITLDEDEEGAERDEGDDEDAEDSEANDPDDDEDFAAFSKRNQTTQDEIWNLFSVPEITEDYDPAGRTNASFKLQ